MLVSVTLDLAPERIAELRQAVKNEELDVHDVLRGIIIECANSQADRQRILDNLGSLI